MGVGSRVQSHKDKLKKETKYDTFRHLLYPGTPEGHRRITSHFNFIKKCGQKVSKKSGVDYDKQTDSIKNPYKKNEEKLTLTNDINCGGIGTLK